MGNRRDLLLNDVARYQKSSDRLVLEEYSSCEVPAGCGGAIVRWIDPHEALPLTLWLWSTAEKVDAFFDGVPIRSSRVDARPGEHVLALVVRPQEGAPAQVAFSLGYTDTVEAEDFEPKRSRATGHKIAILSGQGATIVGTDVEPAGDGWMRAAFDITGWRILRRAKKVWSKDDRRDWHLERVKKTGAAVVEIPGHVGPLWVRCAFEIALPEAS